MKNYEVEFFNDKSKFVGCQPVIKVLWFIVDHCLKVFQILSAYKILVSSAKKKLNLREHLWISLTYTARKAMVQELVLEEHHIQQQCYLM